MINGTAKYRLEEQINRLEELIGRLGLLHEKTERLLATSNDAAKPLSAPHGEGHTQALQSNNQEAIDKYIRDWHMNQGLDPDG